MTGEAAVQRFACTQCGKCCNRPPEVELSEAAGLTDIFVFRLMFRLYWLSHRESDFRPTSERPANTNVALFERKRLLSAFAARKYPVKLWHDGKRVEYTKYLVISALTVDTIGGVCSALRGKLCGIHDRRPLSCRSVPIHYSRPEALAGSDLDTFVGTTGYECDTSDAAEIVLSNGLIVAPELRAARSEALAVAQRDRLWSEAIVRRMNGKPSSNLSLPTLQEIEANAQFGAMTTSMRAAWQIAADAALIAPEECDGLIKRQLQTIRQELALGRCSPEAIESLSAMELEYRHHLNGYAAIAMNG
jgi:Fe-S-cluster containining protein